MEQGCKSRSNRQVIWGDFYEGSFESESSSIEAQIKDDRSDRITGYSISLY
jgi:hypothetical protein